MTRFMTFEMNGLFPTDKISVNQAINIFCDFQDKLESMMKPTIGEKPAWASIMSPNE